MLYTIKHKIYGDRSVFGYSGAGAGQSSGFCTIKEALDMITQEYKEYDWTYSKWVDGNLVLEFEKRVRSDQIIETVELYPEFLPEFNYLKKWEQSYEHLQG